MKKKIVRTQDYTDKRSNYSVVQVVEVELEGKTMEFAVDFTLSADNVRVHEITKGANTILQFFGFDMIQLDKADQEVVGLFAEWEKQQIQRWITQAEQYFTSMKGHEIIAELNKIEGVAAFHRPATEIYERPYIYIEYLISDIIPKGTLSVQTDDNYWTTYEYETWKMRKARRIRSIVNAVEDYISQSRRDFDSKNKKDLQMRKDELYLGTMFDELLDPNYQGKPRTTRPESYDGKWLIGKAVHESGSAFNNYILFSFAAEEEENGVVTRGRFKLDGITHALTEAQFKAVVTAVIG